MKPVLLEPFRYQVPVAIVHGLGVPGLPMRIHTCWPDGRSRHLAQYEPAPGTATEPVKTTRSRLLSGLTESYERVPSTSPAAVGAVGWLP